MLRAMILAITIGVAPVPAADFETAVSNGLRYLQGLGVPRDHVRALMWFYIARSRNAAAGSYVRLVEPYLSPAQTGHARDMADRCLARAKIQCDLIAEQ